VASGTDASYSEAASTTRVSHETFNSESALFILDFSVLSGLPASPSRFGLVFVGESDLLRLLTPASGAEHPQIQHGQMCANLLQRSKNADSIYNLIQWLSYTISILAPFWRIRLWSSPSQPSSRSFIPKQHLWRSP
jgi:hypothetical protein